MKPKPRTRRQPPGLVRINPRHWLAKDLVFAHTGRLPFIFGRPSPDPSPSALRGILRNGTGDQQFTGTWGWVPDGTNYEIYDLGIVGLSLPMTLSAWWYGTSGTTADVVLAVGRSGATGGGNVRRASNERVHAQSVTTGGVSVEAQASGGYSSGRWQHGVGVLISDTSRIAYADGANSGSNVTSSTFPTDCNEIRLAATPSTTPTACTTVISGFALPLVIARALDADEVLRLYLEQAANPWGLFDERRIWVPSVYGTTSAGVPDTAAGVATASTMAGKSTAVAACGTAAGAATTSTLAGKALAIASFGASAGVATPSALAGSSTAVSAIDPAAGVSTAAEMVSASSGTRLGITAVYFWRRTA